ncbi:aminoglycoside phosphotransferase [Janibacter sp. HTCC2649]|uniref:aminoglycoside phosphotransferase n=1 Tax=Janibacter sp. HTCC2649 TaxID=313589 RepID=UPI000592F36D|nr:aminoglycoside phosphotransferase [Janibacter sp. HTCC2649]
MPDSLSGRLAERLSPAQRERVGEWLPGAVFVRDHSWGLTGTVVLEAVVGPDRVIIKAADESDGHLARELRAHREWLGPWVAAGRAPQLLHADGDARVLVTQFIPGELVEGKAAEREIETYRQAGALLAALHGQLEVADEGYWKQEQLGALGWLDKEHRIDAEIETRLRSIVGSWPTPVSVLVPTHGDWQPRNWVTHEGVVSAIDFGRAALRPAYTDLSRLSAQQFLRDPRLEDAFLEGYGSDPRDPEGWQRQRIREAIGTAVWAHQVGDADFEAQGHRMLAAALADEGKLA